MYFIVRIKGGPGSGHYGHAGRPGKHGGSLPSGIAMSIRTGRAAVERAAAKKKPAAPKKEPSVIAPSGPMSDDWWKTDDSNAPGDFDTSYIADMKASDYLSGDVPARDKYTQGWEGPGTDVVIDSKKNMVVGVTQHANGILAERGLSATSHEAVGGVVKSWAGASNSSTRALSLQMAAAEEFGFELSKWQKSLVAKNAKASVSATDRAILRGMYNNTQEDLRNAGYKPGDTIKLFRGLAYGEDKPNLRAGKNVAYKGNVLDSWTLSDVVASEFATIHGLGKHGGWSAAAGISVPMESIFSTSRTGFGCMEEGEFVLFGTIPGSKVNVFWVDYMKAHR